MTNAKIHRQGDDFSMNKIKGDIVGTSINETKCKKIAFFPIEVYAMTRLCEGQTDRQAGRQGGREACLQRLSPSTNESSVGLASLKLCVREGKRDHEEKRGGRGNGCGEGG